VDFLLDLPDFLIKYPSRLMKIAQCLEYPLELRGGVSVVVESLATELSRQGHRIILVSPDSPETIGVPNFHEVIERHIHWNPREPSIVNARKLSQQLAAAGVDVAHFHTGGNYGWGNRFPFHSPVCHLSKLGIPAIWTSHRAETILAGFCGPQKPFLFKMMFFPIAWLGKMQQLHCCRFEVAVSRDNFRKLRRWYAPLRSRFVQIYHTRLQNGREEDTNREKIILCVGHLAAVKGQTVLVEAFSRIAERYPNFTLLLAGHDGGDGTWARVQELIQRHRLEKRVVLLGQNNNIEALMRRASIYVQPSLNEALGLALQEAMCYGCAVIGSRVGGIPELIEENQTGALVAPGDASELSSSLERLICDPNLARQWGAAAARSIRDRGMTVECMARKYIELYERATKRN